MKESTRDYELATKVARLSDDMLIGSAELAAFMGVSPLSIQTGRVRLPPRISGLSRKMQWRLGDVRAFIGIQKTTPETVSPRRRLEIKAEQNAEKVAAFFRGQLIAPETVSLRRGRPTKAEQVAGTSIKSV